MLIIADNSDEEDVSKIVMGEDLSGNDQAEGADLVRWMKVLNLHLLPPSTLGETIMIPVVMISKNDGAMIRDFLFAEMADLNTRDMNSQVRISIVFNKVRTHSHLSSPSL